MAKSKVKYKFNSELFFRNLTILVSSIIAIWVIVSTIQVHINVDRGLMELPASYPSWNFWKCFEHLARFLNFM